jgi:hypothetical protein
LSVSVTKYRSRLDAQARIALVVEEDDRIEGAGPSPKPKSAGSPNVWPENVTTPS